MNKPVDKMFWEDFEVGQVFSYGEKRVTREEIIAFANAFDPQPFHTDEHVAKESFFGGLVASGWHTGSMFMRMFAEHMLAHTASAGSPGIEQLRWTRPVRPGDVLRVRSEVLEKRAPKSRPDFGFVRNRHEVFNQSGELVMWCISPAMILRRATEPAP